MMQVYIQSFFRFISLTMFENNITASTQSTFFQQILNCGKKVKVHCADAELLENEVVVLLLLYHQFHQAGLNLGDESPILLPDYTSDMVLKFKNEFLTAQKCSSMFIHKDNKFPTEELKLSTNCMPIDKEYDEMDPACDVLSPGDPSVTHPEDSYNCDQCDSMLKSKKSLMAHIKSKHEGFRFSCIECSETFTSNHSLKVHKESIHEGIKYSCSECDNVYSTTGHLRVHKLSKHSGLVFDCDQCSYQTSSQRALKEHIRSHLEANIFCDQCDFRTAVERKLKLHIQAKHDPDKDPENPNERICEMCGFVAGNTSELTKHKRGKHAEAKFHCDQCLFKTTCEKSLKKHKQNNHKLK